MNGRDSLTAPAPGRAGYNPCNAGTPSSWLTMFNSPESSCEPSPDVPVAFSWWVNADATGTLVGAEQATPTSAWTSLAPFVRHNSPTH